MLASAIILDELEDTAELAMADGRTMRRMYRVTAKHPAEQTNDIELIYYVTDQAGSIKRLVQQFPLRYFFRFELEHLLVRAGFEITELYGSLDRSPFTDSSPEMIVIAARKD